MAVPKKKGSKSQRNQRRAHDALKASSWVVFVPGAPNPMTGRVIVIDALATQPAPISVNEAMRALVAVGKTGTERLAVK